MMFSIAFTEGQVLGHDHSCGRLRWGSLEDKRWGGETRVLKDHLYGC